ncbi:MAG: potassium channel protein [Thiolinea sp.]
MNAMPSIFYVLLRRLRKPLIVLISIYAVAILGFVLIPGQDDQGQPWQMSFFHAFYFVSYMASTIGFGEIPYVFTDAQRMWAMVTIYACVIGWLYSIGALLGVLQDPAFRKLRQEQSFRRRVELLHTPFYLVCGYGDTGDILVRSFAEEGIHSVVIDRDESRINELELNDYARLPLGIVGDSANPKVLESAGVNSPYCLGVIALTDSDQVNLLVALSTHLLRPKLRFLARADSVEAVANIGSFGDNEVINPFDTFAGRLAMALNNPGYYILFEWLTGVPNSMLDEPSFPQHGSWIVCGYGRFGKALYERLQASGLETTIIEAFPKADDPEHLINGLGTEASTLLEAGIKSATGIVAGTDNDANNLSILMTARELNPGIFMVARQNNRQNSLIFERADFHLTMKRGDVIANKIIALLRTPLINDFLNLATERDEIWANNLLSRMLGVTNEKVPYLWELKADAEQSPALYEACVDCQREVLLETLLRDPRDREQTLKAIPLLLKREGAVLLLPEVGIELRPDDRVLMCATRATRNDMEWAAQHIGVLHYLLTGEENAGQSLFWRWCCRVFAKDPESTPSNSA